MLRSLVLFVVLCAGSGLAVAGVTTLRPVVQPPPPVAPADADAMLGEPPLEIVDSEPVVLPAVPEQLGGVAPVGPLTAPAPAPPVPASQHTRDVSVDALNTCHAALRDHRPDAAIAACRAAVGAWSGNHLAWYGLANAHGSLGAWREARAAIGHAVALRPELAMYQLVDGVARYRSHDPAGARGALERALAREPRLWRAHHLLGLLDRDQGAARSAADHLTAAIRTNPGERASYLALAQLYRTAGLGSEALAIATLGTRKSVGGDSVALWFEVALAADLVDDQETALAALDRAIVLAPDDALLRLARGRVHFLRRERAAARNDLESVARSTAPANAAARRRAEQLLAELAPVSAQVWSARACSEERRCSASTLSSWMGAAWVSPASR